MRFLTLFLSFLAVFNTAVTTNALLIDLDPVRLLGVDFSARTNYNAPRPPWVGGAVPGWYFGPHPERHPKLFCLVGLVCRLLDLLPLPFKCPKLPPRPPPKPTPTGTYPQPTPTPPADGYEQTFKNLTGATQGHDYLTFGLVDTVPDCKAMCNGIPECKFANTYYDVNGKDGSTQLTCALFKGCHDASTATNEGGQTQPDGSINYIRNSDGWCKA
ncbi:hypothetical protein CC1G_09727 [Coprinopsis cinerea okayama7|uniref:Apple domain-containing protein n=1 Tax=Coprinopsis cinerea (strain Okayama-7 / 130 / ATCC MYA-4618 / FGSC 9003) TaxID=240176 RepID=A8NJH5_COPC7|nr:hypothetical protein CC1G_09727 [Coprinopsis cinerea okayama7\|eukprot:XP_001834227.1 hypothetical protein CC1G_09727 [Coprinopsis cinerea okayama7\